MSEQEIIPIGDIASNYAPNPMIRRHGRGPEGETCRTCAHLVATSPTGKTYWKCDRYSLSNSDASDFRSKWDACRLFTLRPGDDAVHRLLRG